MTPLAPQPDVDPVDMALLEEMRRDGRATYETLGRLLGLSRAAARTRLRRLLDSGLVRIVGVVHPSVFGLTAYAHAAIAVDGPVGPVAERVVALDTAPFVSAVTGRWALVAELRCPDRAALAEDIRRIAALPGVRRVDTTVYTEILKDAYFPPQDSAHTPMPIDDTDRVLLAELQRDGRAPFATLGEAVGLSPGAARTRVLRLLEAGAVHVGARVYPQALGLAHHTGFELTFGDGAETAVERIRTLDRVQYLATAIGRCDAVGTLTGYSAEDVFRSLEELRATPGVRTVESWTHLWVVKESYDRSPLTANGRAGEEN
ncbi:Lrp/AsnC family transcriptional regulator [Streptomyces sp. NBC_01803]|uniref:Lrp/AsnC family transcriptional regulator n=1 Tax=Streptomyces sp. NBC_01803 TaxID=2975946 RepID=UPI002DD9161E|nr:Lrp/AsnC family transcriptional regulator [Streptomyces sp. NBC_01803]WSA45026.1 Lrp/AsnC family transcriptional regulator [Streptomyces sp. NBC_01803]